MTHEEIALKLGVLGYTDASEVNEILHVLEEYSNDEQEAILNQFPPSGGLIGFNGQNCEDARYIDDAPDCGGWDGYSRRCDCGNRRVSWVVEGMWAYGDAY